MGDYPMSELTSSETGEISFIYKKKEPTTEPDKEESVYEVPSTIPTLPAPKPPTLPKLRPQSNMSTDLLERLTQNLSINSRYLKSLAKEADYIDDEARAPRKERIPVEVRITFLKVIDVNTCKQQYEAEVFLQAKWTEPALAGMAQKDLDNIDLRKLWDPLVQVTNIVGELDEDRKWRSATAQEAGYRYPLMYFRRRMRGTFVEPLELKNFPVDVQGLTLKVASDRSYAEVDFLEDVINVSSVYTENFTDEHEWLIYEHVEAVCHKHTASDEHMVEVYGGDDTFSDSFKHPTADFICHVSRKPGYFLWNVILVIFLITALTFAAWAINPEQPEFRIPVILILLLTLVAFRFVVGNILPPMSYITYLDIYVLAALIFLCTQVVAVAVASVYAKRQHKDYKDIDTYLALGLAILLAFFNVVYLAYLFIKGFIERQKMLDKDEEYFAKLRKMKERRLRKYPMAKVAPQPTEPLPLPEPDKPNLKPQKENPKIVYIKADTQEAEASQPKHPKPRKEKKTKQPTPKLEEQVRKEKARAMAIKRRKATREYELQNARVYGQTPTLKSRSPPRVAPQPRPQTPEYEMAWEPQPAPHTSTSRTQPQPHSSIQEPPNNSRFDMENEAFDADDTTTEAKKGKKSKKSHKRNEYRPGRKWTPLSKEESEGNKSGSGSMDRYGSRSSENGQVKRRAPEPPTKREVPAAASKGTSTQSRDETVSEYDENDIEQP